MNYMIGWVPVLCWACSFLLLGKSLSLKNADARLKKEIG